MKNTSSCEIMENDFTEAGMTDPDRIQLLCIDSAF